MSATSERLYVVGSGAAQNTSVAVALVAATAKTVISFLGAATDSLALVGFSVSFASVTSTDVPAFVEIGRTSTLGTVTAYTPTQVSGSLIASSATAGYNATAEPTYTNVFRRIYIPVNNGCYEFWYPLGREPVTTGAQGFAMRVTAPQAQSCHANFTFSE